MGGNGAFFLKRSTQGPAWRWETIRRLSRKWRSSIVRSTCKRPKGALPSASISSSRRLPPSNGQAKKPGNLWPHRSMSSLYAVRFPLHSICAREIQEKGHDDEYTYRCERTE